MNIRNKITKALIVLVVFLVSAIATHFVLVFVSNGSSDSTIAVQETSDSLPEFDSEFEAVDPRTSVNILLLGYGGEGHDGGMLSDVLIVANVDTLKKRVSLISIPRDTWVSIPIQSDKSANYKVNMAHAIGISDTAYPLKEPQYKGELGGGELAKKVVGDIVGMDIDYFISIDFSSFEEAIDILGGLDVVVPKTFDDYFYPIKGFENETCGFSAEEIADFHVKYSGFDLEKQFTCRYEHIHYDEGIAHMDGVSALKYVRSRHSEQHGGDFARSERQQALLVAAKNKILSLGVLDDVVPFFESLSHTFTTDIDTKLIKQGLNAAGNLSDYKVSMVRLSEENVFVASTSSNGQFILIPKNGGGWDSIHNYILSKTDN